MNRSTHQPAGSRPQPQLSTQQLLTQSLNKINIPTSPNRTEPISGQFQIFLDNFSILTNSIFHQISTNTIIPNHSPQQILNDLSHLDNYLIQLLNLHSEHDQNCKQIQELMEKISDLRYHQIDSKIQEIYHAEQKISRVCIDGKKDKQTFRRIASLSLTPNQILNHAKLIAPYTSAPPVPPTTNPDNATTATAGLDLQDPALRFLMPFPTEDIIRRGRMGQEMSGINPNEGIELGPVVGETRMATGARPTQVKPQTAYPTMSSRRPPPPDQDDDLFDLDLNPDL
ncbi:hypothetical protein CROQUDRAFT_452493 [Cronartium quercuum f. sp. fusiforme G11]|uniref:Mediator of RNA polymerase II transcription subunit 4 n=1 Tax=Cronartium quercuum f. sp. fusiforme G11 TaxID=708437 RepID=A0A9P6NKT5_9BASI|nr:hypothetical protein CROQUDRAFT_452493 [Cronartium quercuum f. sp. fusiforme G11]